MLTRADIQRLKEHTDPIKRVKELENSLSIALDLNDTMQRENKKLTDQCMTAGRAMIELNLKYESAIKEIDRLSEENTNLKTMMKGTDGKSTSNDS
tara:strand:+ start:201 stop:488 length:288 start_codon:yes stop_codon:yes gene_type:complete